MYQYKKERLKELERLAVEEKIDLYYGDQTHVSSQGYVAYGWQFEGEEVCTYVEKGYKVNIFGLIDLKSNCHWTSSEQSINSSFVVDYLEKFSMKIRKETVIVLDNASIHCSKFFQKARQDWEKRGLFIFFLPTYSPELNRAEILWRRLKAQWIDPMDYFTLENLRYAINQAMNAIGTILNIKFNIK